MTDSPLRAKGRAMRRNLMGAAYADKLDRQLYTDPIMEKFAALTQETVFGSLWTRPELDLKTLAAAAVYTQDWELNNALRYLQEGLRRMTGAVFAAKFIKPVV